VSEDAAGRPEPIAIIGVSGQFPMARELDELWANLQAGRDCISEVPPERWRWQEFYGDAAAGANQTRVKWGGFLDGIDEFDSLFFGISPREAAWMDPQQRLLLTHAWKAIEEAGYSPASLSGRPVAVFLGTASTGYGPLAGGAPAVLEGVSGTASVPSIGPNRISYLLNLRGASEAIETACSSSLVAIHRAIVELRAGSCEMAIAGGANTLISPLAQIAFSKAGMLCEDGRCKTFSARANGYARGEGVGILVLKPLRSAEADGDHIHAVLLGSATGHGGKANSLTAPSAHAQADVLEAAYRQAGVDPRTVSYIETHGTGTPLGDPIEINGLKRAFQRLRGAGGEPDAPYCGLGSVKTNIGHLELAAGVAGVIKVLLQLQHRRLAPSLHCDEINPYIKLDGSPFFLVRQAMDWPALRDSDGAELPRRAGVSSFGFGGVNAHVVLEEYIPAPRPAPGPSPRAPRPPALVVLSARDGERLVAGAAELVRALEAAPGLDLHDLAYTLQVGRVAMEHRLGVRVESIAELAHKLTAFAAGAPAIPELYRGEARRGADALNSLFADEDMAEVVATWIRKRKHDKLLELWTRGLRFDWNQLHGDDRPRRVSLPGARFAPVRHWLPRSAPPTTPPASPRAPQVSAVRTLDAAGAVVYEVAIAPDDPLVDHHRVAGARLVPAAGMIALVVEAVAAWHPGPWLALRELAWTAPLEVTAPRTVQLRLSRDGAVVAFEITGAAGAVHGRGQIALDAPAPEAPPAPPSALCERLALRWRGDADRSRFYDAFSRVGVRYGAAYRRIGALWGSAGESVALIEPEPDAPVGLVGLLDAAFQSLAGSLTEPPSAPLVPFSLDALILSRAPLPPRAYAHARSAGPHRHDIDVLDEHGRLVAQLRGFAVRPLPAARIDALTHLVDWQARPAARAVDDEPRGTTLVLHAGDGSGFERAVAARSGTAVTARIAPSTRQLDRTAWDVDLTDPRKLSEWLVRIPDLGSVIFLGGLGSGAEAGPAAERAEHLVQLWLGCARALIDAGFETRSLGIAVVTSDVCSVRSGDAVQLDGAGLIGLTSSLAKELPCWKVKIVDLAAAELADPARHGALADHVAFEPWSTAGRPVAYRAGRRYESRIVPAVLPAPSRPAFRDQGVYVIAGGAGGLGQVTSRHLIERHGAQVVWLGRRPIDDKLEAQIAALARGDVRPVYLQADLGDAASVASAAAEIRARFSRVHGVIHSALELRDRRLGNMDGDTLAAALRPKLRGGVNLWTAFCDDELDWMCFYSSMQSFVGAPGQGNYAAGSTFIDALARFIKRRASYPVHTLNWGYWGEVGAVASDAYRRRMAERGIGSIEPAEGMAIVERALSSRAAQLLVIKAEPAARTALGIATDAATELYPWHHDEVVTAIGAIALPEDSPPELAGRIGERDLLDGAAVAGLERLFARPGWAEHIPAPAAAPAAIGDLARALGIADRHRPLFRELLAMLGSSGWLRKLDEPGEAYGRAELREPGPGLSAADLAARHPDLAPHAQLLAACLDALPAVLSGRRPATAVLFPEGSMHLVEPIYRGGLVEARVNGRVAHVVRDAITELARRRSGQTLRILEVGAGTGGTTERVLEVLRDAAPDIEYVYTDVSQAFLDFAAKKLGTARPRVTFRRLDATVPWRDQGFAPASFHVAIAANVLHATPDVAWTLANLKGLLARSGVLVLSELTAKRPFLTLTFGLLDGWWACEDPARRIAGSPCLSPEAWREVLEGAGFEPICFADQAIGASTGQHVIVASSDGHVRAQVAPRSRPDAGPPPTTAPSAPALRASPSATLGRQAQVEQLLLEIVQELLKVAPGTIDLDLAVSDLGVDSIVAIDLVRRINQVLGCSLPTTRIFDFPSVRRLAGHLVEHHAAEVDVYLRGPDAEATAPASALIDDLAARLTNDELYLDEALAALDPVHRRGQLFARPA
jgi:acyl transferase domain-containing protein/acyl carrier protein